MTREEWIKRYAARIVRGGSWRTEAQAIAAAEAGADATEQAGDMNPDDWEGPEALADEHLASECHEEGCDLMPSSDDDDQAWDREAERTTRQAGIGEEPLNMAATNVMDL